MTATQHQFCCKITDKILKCPISGPFRDPVDSSQVPGYLDVIKPMDLNSVMRKLNENQCLSVDELGG
jgi:hypothetical protein